MRITGPENEFTEGFDAAASQDAEEFARLDKRVADLEAALQPFAKAWRVADDGTGTAVPPGICIYCADKHFRRAAELVPAQNENATSPKAK